MLSVCSVEGLSAQTTNPAVAASDYSSLFLKSDGTVWAVGDNNYGQLGVTNGNGYQYNKPVQVFTGTKAISAGRTHSLLLKADGTVWATGDNTYGQLGVSPVYTFRTFTPIQVLTGVAAISAGSLHSLFLKTDGTVWACGRNDYGQLGSGNKTDRSTPVQVLSGVTAISAGEFHSLFLKTDGTVWASGDNSWGQLGNGNTDNSTTPVQVQTGVSAISAGSHHSLFLKTDKTVVASGWNLNGQLGNDSASNTANFPQAVRVLTGVSAISCGLKHSLFLKTDGTVWACGNNSDGQLGDGSITERYSPVQVATGVAAISAGIKHSLFAKIGNGFLAAGSNIVGQLGTADLLQRRSPTEVLFPPLISNQPSSATISAGSAHTLTVTAPGTSLTYQWYLGTSGTTNNPIGGATAASYTTPVLSATTSYWVRVFNAAGWADSATATVSVKPAITSQSPPNTNVAASSTATLTVTAAGPSVLTYQWYTGQDGDISAPISGATLATYRPPALSVTTSYWVRVSNSAGSADSTTMTISVPPTIATQPGSSTIVANTTANLNVTASAGNGYGLSYQWYQGTSGSITSPITGATAAEFRTPTLQTNTSYWVRVTNLAGFVNSATATISVVPSVPSPEPVTIGTGSTATLRANAVGTGLTYQWYRGPSGNTTTPIGGATSANFSTPTLTTSAEYWVRVSNASGSTDSATFTVVVIPPPVISTSPASVTVNSGSSATLSVSAVGTNLNYQWYRGASGTTTTPIGGANSASYTTPALTAPASYWVRVWNIAGAADSGSAAVTIVYPPVITSVANTIFYRSGGNPTFSVSATGTGLTYQWYAGVSGDTTSPVNGATAATFSPTDTSPYARYWVRVSNAEGFANSTTYAIYTPQTALAAALSYTLILRSDEVPWGSGLNSSGQLGIGSTSPQNTPAPATALASIKAVSAGEAHSLFLKGDGSVWATGLNSSGQLGNSSLTPQTTPVVLPGISKATAIAAGKQHSLFLKNDGTVWAAGANGTGQLGLGGTSASQITPVQISALSGVVAIAAGGQHSLFLKNDGTVWAAGSNTFGQLGIGSTPLQAIPLQVPIGGVVAIAAGSLHSLFLKTDGTVWATGHNAGQLGVGTTLGTNTPVQVTALTDITMVAAGVSHSLFLKRDGTAWACGNNGNGQLGTANIVSQQTTPVQVATTGLVSAIAAGQLHSLFLKQDGSVWSTGINTNGELGIGNTTQQNTPVRVLSLTRIPQTLTFAPIGLIPRGSASVVLSASTSSGLPITYTVVSGPATLNGSTLTLTGEGAITVRASQVGNLDYAPVTTEQSFTFTRAVQTLTFPLIAPLLATKATATLTASVDSPLAITYTIVSGPATVSGSTLIMTGEGTVTIRASQAGNAAYAPVSSEQSFEFKRIAQTIDWATIPPQKGGTPLMLAATASSGLSLAFTVVSGPGVISGNRVLLDSGSGSVTVRASHPGNAVYEPVSAEQTFLVTRLSQTINWSTIGDRLEGESVPLSAVASSTLPITYTVVAGPAQLLSGTVKLTGSGSVTLRATQAGNAVHDPVSVEQTFGVRANIAGPVNLLLSPAWFKDASVSGTLVGKLSATDADAGEVLAFSLVSGVGDTDNTKFRIVGDQLQTFGTPNYLGRVKLSVRVRVTDLAGHTLEGALPVTRVESTPFAKFVPRKTFPGDLSDPKSSYVNAIFQLKDAFGKGLNFPKDLVDQDRDLFLIKEDGVRVSPSESFMQIGKIDNVPVKVRTILLLDISNSIGGNLPDVRAAAKSLVDSMFKQQEVAIYTFDAAPHKIAGFTSQSPKNQQDLKDAIDSITLGVGTTNLYGSIIEMLNLEDWRESASQTGIETTFLIVMTDGAHTAGLGLDVPSVIAARGEKKIYTVGIQGADLNEQALKDIQNEGYKSAASIAELSRTFTEIQSDILNEANSFYWANYASPQLGDYNHILTVELRGNRNQGSDKLLQANFNSNGFKPVERGLYINRTPRDVKGIPTLPWIVAKDSSSIAYAFTVLPPVGKPAYTWTIANPGLASLTPGGPDGSMVTITPKNLDGTTKLKLIDTANTMEREISIQFGNGVALPSQTINFAAIPYKLVTAAPFTLSATASSGLPVAYSVASGPATLGSDGRTLTLTGVGTVTVVATQAGSANYAPAQPVTRTFTVTEAPVILTPQTITFGPLASRTFGDAPFELVATASSGLPVTFSVVSGPATIGVNGTTLTLTGAGTVIIRAAQAGNATYAAATAVDRSFVVTSGTQGDSDDDGVDDAWELTWFGNLTTAGLNTDSDGDGFSDVEEFLRDLDPTAETAFTNQPDAAIGFGSKRLIGRDVYDSRGSGQVAEAAVANRKTKTCFIEIRNGGTARSSFKVLGNGSTENFRVRYMVGTLDVTKKVVAGTYVVKSLAPGKSKILKVLVTVGKKAEAEETFAVNVDLVSDVDPEARDRATYNVIVK